MKKIVIIALMIICNVTTFQAQQFVYKPTNPAFGGDTFNYNWLLSSAAAQNQFKDTGATSSSTSTLDSFTDSINRQLLSQLSSKLFSSQFPDGNLKPGSYLFGSLYIEITQGTKGLIIKILNTSTGEQSEIIVPQ